MGAGAAAPQSLALGLLSALLEKTGSALPWLPRTVRTKHYSSCPEEQGQPPLPSGAQPAQGSRGSLALVSF